MGLVKIQLVVGLIIIRVKLGDVSIFEVKLDEEDGDPGVDPPPRARRLERIRWRRFILIGSVDMR